MKLLHGERADRINRHEPVARDALPVCPDDVSPEVRAVWDYTLAELVAMKLASSADRDALLAYCEAVVLHRKASATLARSTGVLIKGANGTPVRNPAVQIQRDAAQLIRAFAQEFGLTPSARSQVVAKDVEQEGGTNPFATVV